MIEVNKIYNEDNLLTCKERLLDCSIDMILTSPPYSDLRHYGQGKDFTWDYHKLIPELYRILKPGGVVVWVVGDQTINGSKTCEPFEQLLYFKYNSFLVHDVMIYSKNSASFPAKPTSKRYSNIFEYMFILVKPGDDGKIRQDIQLLKDKVNKWAGFQNWGKLTHYDKDGKVERDGKINPVPEFSLRNNIWTYTTSCEKDKTGHPAIFPEQLAIDHILSWSNEGDIIYDPFMGSGTTAKACLITNRKYIGSEISSEYYKIILERLNTFERYGGKVNYNIKSKVKKEEKNEVEENPLF